MRTSGSSHYAIAAAGGGVDSTVTVTRGTDPWTLCNGVRERLRQWILAGHHHRRGQDRLPPHPRRRARRHPDAALARGRAVHAAHPRHLPRRAHPAARVLRPPPRLHRGRPPVGRRRRRRGRRHHRRLLRRGPLHRRGGPRPAAHRPARRAKARMHACANERIGAAQVAAEVGCASADLLTAGQRRRHQGARPRRRHRHRLPRQRAQQRPPPRRSARCSTAASPSRSAPTTTPASAASPPCPSSSACPSPCSASASPRPCAPPPSAARPRCASATAAPWRPACYADIVLWDADHEGAFAWAFGLRALRVWRGGVPVQP